MNWLQRMNHAIDYIEDNLEKNIDYEQLARIALCSVYQFQRMFSFVLEVSLSEYIRRRRLTLAAFDLKNRQNKVTDIALKYGYETPESFSRAFQNLHGLTPTLARNAESQLKAYPRISFQMILKGVVEMNYRIEKRDAFQVFGLEDIYNYDDIANQEGVSIPEVWQNICTNGQFDRLRQSVIGDWWSEGNFSKELGAEQFLHLIPTNSQAIPLFLILSAVTNRRTAGSLDIQLLMFQRLHGRCFQH
ncbi:helix-turn-helix domain-containing protein [Paenibacillus dokdonensis]|uniref:helix-turn-helix domain-containing protein n=1 Tax=Paenibacillus dokdonensis TaxID=2567944 RepID=UPI001FEA543B|nr:helix-turn-helix domain-containing protein [Paenibacillus dokdonensis]